MSNNIKKIQSTSQNNDNIRCNQCSSRNSSKIFFNNVIFIIFLSIFYDSFLLTNEKSLTIDKLLNLGEITMKINGPGTKRILGDDFNATITELYINGDQKNDIGNSIELEEEKEYIINIRFNESITSCAYMFQNVEAKEIDLSRFETSEVLYMDNMFYGCSNLISINFSNIITSSVLRMDYMFYNCINLEYLNLLDFDTSNVQNMSNIFFRCSSLSSLDLSNFNTFNIQDMTSMFENCGNLTSLDLSKFDTSKVLYMNNLFTNCESLQTLNLSNLYTSESTGMENIFSGCDNLLILDLSNINNTNYIFLALSQQDFSSLKYINLYQSKIDSFDIFNNFSNDLVLCIDNINIAPNTTIENINNNCSNPCFEKDATIILEKEKCVIKCEEDDTYRNEYKNKCYKECPIGTYNSSTNPYHCEDCYSKCKNCEEYGNDFNNNCMECYSDMILIKDFNKNNCYEKCKFYYYIDESGNYQCTENLECPEEYFHLISEEKRCIKEENITYDKDIARKDQKIKNFGQKTLNNEDIFKNLLNGKPYLVNDDNMILIATTSHIQKNNSYKNISSIDLKECEDKLRFIYNINDERPLIILKVDYYPKDTNIPIVGYEIYHPFNKSKLDLSHCNNISIKVNIPVDIDESILFKYNPNSDYYTDNCYPYTTDNGTDIILSDRKKEYGENNLSLCENNCDYNEYNSENKQSSCNCKIKNKMDLASDIEINTQKLSNVFASEQNSSSSSIITTIKCTQTLFTKNGLIKNISNYIISVSFIYYLLSILLFIKCGYRRLVNDITKIINSKKINIGKKDMDNIYNRNNKITKNKKSKYNNKKKKKNNPPKKSKIGLSDNLDLSIKSKSNSKSLLHINKLDTNIDKKLNGLNRNKKKRNKFQKLNDSKKIKENIMKKNFPKNNFSRIINNIQYNDYELNTLDYKNAILYDKRTCCKYYIALLRIKHPLLFGFCPIRDYNSLVIKLCIFLLSFDVYYVVNFFFFDAKDIHKIYDDAGRFDIIYFIPRILISFAISHIITIIIKLLFLSERNIAQIRKEQIYHQVLRLATKEKKNIICKYVIFYILGIIFLFAFWMLLSSFGAVFQNSQIILFENVLVSFSISLIYPIFFNIIPCLFRYCSLGKGKNLECLYDMSKFLQIL